MSSGFSLAAVYGSRPWQPIRLLDLLLPCYKRKAFRDTKKPEGEGQAFDTRRFYYNRLTRLMPTYYLCLLLVSRLIPISPSLQSVVSLERPIDLTLLLLLLQAIPLVFLGYHSSSPAAFLPNLFIGLLPIQSWCSAFFGWGLNEPAWFITTLLSFYLLFPYWLTRAQRQTDQQLARGLVAWYFFQLAILLAIFHGLQTPYVGRSMGGGGGGDRSIPPPPTKISPQDPPCLLPLSSLHNLLEATPGHPAP